jgi:uncharacterized integral membrane protein (TIGR00698 family)
VTAPTPSLATAIARVLVPVGFVAALCFPVTPAVALVAGIAIALTLGNPWPDHTGKLAHRSLAIAVVGLGAGANLAVVGRVGLHGLGYTALGIACAFALGTWLGRRLRVAGDTSLLVTAGTAICGGSAIAAVSAAIRAKPHEVSVAIATVFMLNAVALFTFPSIGTALHLAPESFGLWCALAIHDTSSVVGAASQYGDRALEVATSAKLARALWIVPVTFVIATLRARNGKVDAASPKRATAKPWFIAGFVATAAIATWVPGMHDIGHVVALVAQRLLAATLLLIGLGLTRAAIRAVGIRPLVMAVILWLFLASATLVGVVTGWIA